VATGFIDELCHNHKIVETCTEAQFQRRDYNAEGHLAGWVNASKNKLGIDNSCIRLRRGVSITAPGKGDLGQSGQILSRLRHKQFSALFCRGSCGGCDRRLISHSIYHAQKHNQKEKSQ
jgi:hypothetical protein